LLWKEGSFTSKRFSSPIHVEKTYHPQFSNADIVPGYSIHEKLLIMSLKPSEKVELTPEKKEGLKELLSGLGLTPEQEETLQKILGRLLD